MKELNALERLAKINAENWEPVTPAGTKEILAIADAYWDMKRRAEATEAKLAERDQLDEEAMHCATILEFIGSFDSDDITGDEVDLRFEIDGEDTGSDVSITEYALRSAKAIRSILAGASISRPAPAINLAELVPDDYFSGLVNKARTSADKAMLKFPQPNYVLLKVAEEAGEVVQAGVHYAENRMTWQELEGEIVQLLAMLIRLVTEGDQVNGITPPEECRAAILRNIEEQSQ